MTITPVLLFAIVGFAFTAGLGITLAVLYIADRRIRAKYDLDTEAKIDAALAAYRTQTPTYQAPNIWLDYELADEAAQAVTP